VDPYRPPGRGPILAAVLLAVALLASTSIAVWQYVELRRAEARIEELEAEGDGGGGIFGDLEETFREAFEEGLGSLGEGVGGLAACLLPDEPFSSEPIGDRPVEEQIAAIAETVERLRGLEFSEPVEPTFLSPEEITARVRELFLEEYTPALGDQEQRILTAVGAIPPGTDLRALRADLLGSQVAGFYDPQTGELVVRRSGDELTVNDRVVLAHELDHALTDQALGLPVPDDLRAGSEDRDLAATALVEGDATLLMQQYSASLSFEDQLGALDPTALVDALQAQTDLAELPHYLQAELRFPYESGLTYVCDRFERGGWAEVDAAYASPPGSTLEVLAPGREPGAPVDLDLSGRLRRPWQRAPERELGAAPLLWLFEAPGGDPEGGLEDAATAIEEWMGGIVELWRRGPETAVAMVIADRPGGAPLCEAVAEWYRRSFDDDTHPHARGYELVADGPTQDALVACADDEVRVGIAPGLDTASRLIH
jgi:hypothetical protein